MTWEIVEHTDKVIELRVTECLWADVYRAMDAEDIGYARVCIADYSWPKSFNLNMKMVRDKTLLQGHECCNRKYLFEG